MEQFEQQILLDQKNIKIYQKKSTQKIPVYGNTGNSIPIKTTTGPPQTLHIILEKNYEYYLSLDDESQYMDNVYYMEIGVPCVYLSSKKYVIIKGYIRNGFFEEKFGKKTIQILDIAILKLYQVEDESI